MNFAARFFFKGVRLVLTPVMLTWEALTTPRGIVRPDQDQREIDSACGALTLYQFRSCPFCIKVRKEMKRLSLDIPLRDARNDFVERAALQHGGGRIRVPCLRVTAEDGSHQWIYESAEIIRYLQQRFA